MDDESELEVSDLRTGTAHDAPPASTQAAQAEATSATASAAQSPLPSRHLPPLLASRRARGVLTAALVLLACAAVVLSLPAARQGIRLALFGPTPTPAAPLPRGADTFYFRNTVPWGRLTADGKPITFTTSVKLVILSRGPHPLEYRADPFAPLRCQVSVPAAPSDTCPRIFGFDVALNAAQAGEARVVDLRLTLDKLPDVQRAALTNAVAAALQSAQLSSAVAPGDHYLGPDGTPRTAAAPMRANLSLTLNTDVNRSLPDGAGNLCVSVCDAHLWGQTNQWLVQANAVTRWQFTTPDGRAVQAGAAAGDTVVPFAVAPRWTGFGWQAALVTGPGYNQICNAGFASAFQGSSPLPNAQAIAALPYEAPNVADGCLSAVIPTQDLGSPGAPGATPTPFPPTTALFLYRFGLVLAANDAAHAAQPRFPVATAHEQSLAQQWLAAQQP